MTGRDDRSRTECSAPDCDRDGSFWWYDRDERSWSPVCELHARHLHPSIEVRAWLQSGYMRPIELDRPDEPPPEPSVERGRAFRAEIDEVMGWSA